MKFWLGFFLLLSFSAALPYFIIEEKHLLTVFCGVAMIICGIVIEKEIDKAMGDTK